MSVLLKPIITEKMSDQNEMSKFGFVVKRGANKVEIRKEIEVAYGVTVLSINTAIYAGKKKSKYTNSKVIKGRLSSYKKAIVTLKEGDFIDFYNGI